MYGILVAGEKRYARNLTVLFNVIWTGHNKDGYYGFRRKNPLKALGYKGMALSHIGGKPESAPCSYVATASGFGRYFFSAFGRTCVELLKVVKAEMKDGMDFHIN